MTRAKSNRQRQRQRQRAQVPTPVEDAVIETPSRRPGVSRSAVTPPGAASLPWDRRGLLVLELLALLLQPLAGWATYLSNPRTTTLTASLVSTNVVVILLSFPIVAPVAQRLTNLRRLRFMEAVTVGAATSIVYYAVAVLFAWLLVALHHQKQVQSHPEPGFLVGLAMVEVIAFLLTAVVTPPIRGWLDRRRIPRDTAHR